MKAFKFSLVFFIVSIHFQPVFAQQNLMPDGKALVQQMHTTYSNGKWYKHFTFSQNMEFYRNDSIVKTDLWHEAISLPGKLIIKFETKDSKNGVIFNNNKVYSFREGAAMQSRPLVHDLLLVGLDVYFYAPQKTIHLLDSLGYNLNKIREDSYDGYQVYVVGADKNDSLSNQFWIDKKHLILRRIIYKQGKNSNDVTFTDYEKINKAWIAKTIVFKNNGKLSLIEKYLDIQYPKIIDPVLFEPSNFNTTTLK